LGRLVIKFTQQKNQLFELDQPGRFVLGRGEECDVVLPNVSVSREHAAVEVGPQGIVLQDLGSANGTLVNGETIESHTLARGDEIQIGKFSMVFLGDGREDRFYKGRYVAYLPKYDPRTVVPDDDAATFAMSVEALKAIQKSNRAVEQARLILERNPDKFWFPEERGITFGGGGLVPIEGLLTWGVPAEISWDGKWHVLENKAIFTRVKVNGESVKRRPLANGDKVQVGASIFRYERPKK
jgi:pSer/pThr/pTyr-binding forkhead associated (FHA) protein